MNRWPVLLAMIGGLSWSSLARAEGGIIFRWVDKQGNLHATDTLAEVPEPYYSLYAAKLREIEEQRNAAPTPTAAPAAPPQPVEPGPSLTEQEARRRAHWKKLVAHWRNELSDATEALAQLDAELAQLQQNPVLRELPHVRAQITAATKRRDDILKRLERARHMLETELPARAKKERVPPKWLM